MKQKILIATNIITLAVAIYLLTRDKGIAPAPKRIIDTVFVEKGGGTNPLPVPSQVCVECAEETHGQTIGHFKNVIQNYRTNIWDVVNTNSHFNTPTSGLNGINLKAVYKSTDARCIWFSLESIKQFICTIEKNNAKLQEPAENLGVRFYYAVYENNASVDIEKRNRHTLFMVPTFRDNSGAEIDFDPRATAQRQTGADFKLLYQNGKVTFANLLSENSTAPFLMLSDGEPNPPKRSTELVKRTTAESSTSLIKNNGEICPTNCPVINTLEAIDQ
jgi:hypothetical protein